MSIPLPESTCPLTISAFRAGFLTVLDLMLSTSIEDSPATTTRRGLFHDFPLLNAVAPQVQLECLLRTWHRWQTEPSDSLDILDECVLQASHDCLAQAATDATSTRLQSALHGPFGLKVEADHWLVSRTRCLQVAGSRLIRQAYLRELRNPDLQPLATDHESLGNEASHEQLLDIVGQWTVDPALVLNSERLLTHDEQDLLRTYFEEHPGLLHS